MSLLGFLSRLLVAGESVRVRRVVRCDGETLFAFLTNLANHWRLAHRFVELVSLEGPPGGRWGGKVRLRGPLGVRRAAHTQVRLSVPRHAIVVRAELGPRTIGWVSWTLTPCDDMTEVELSAEIESLGALDRLVLLLGGRRWLRRRLQATLATLCEVAAAAEDVDVQTTPDRHAALVAAAPAEEVAGARSVLAMRGAA